MCAPDVDIDQVVILYTIIPPHLLTPLSQDTENAALFSSSTPSATPPVSPTASKTGSLPREAPVLPKQCSRIVQASPQRTEEILGNRKPWRGFSVCQDPVEPTRLIISKFPTPYAQRIAPGSWHFRTDAALSLPHNATSTDPSLLDPLLHFSRTPLFFIRSHDRPCETITAFSLLV